MKNKAHEGQMPKLVKDTQVNKGPLSQMGVEL
jgi:hypothetical protein